MELLISTNNFPITGFSYALEELWPEINYRANLSRDAVFYTQPSDLIFYLTDLIALPDSQTPPK